MFFFQNQVRSLRITSLPQPPPCTAQTEDEQPSWHLIPSLHNSVLVLLCQEWPLGPVLGKESPMSTLFIRNSRRSSATSGSLLTLPWLTWCSGPVPKPPPHHGQEMPISSDLWSAVQLSHAWVHFLPPCPHCLPPWDRLQWCHLLGIHCVLHRCWLCRASTWPRRGAHVPPGGSLFLDITVLRSKATFDWPRFGLEWKWWWQLVVLWG